MNDEHQSPQSYLQMMYEQSSELCDTRFFRRRHPGDSAEVPLAGTAPEGGALEDVTRA